MQKLLIPQRRIVGILMLLIIVFGIVITLSLIRNQQNLTQHAASSIPPGCYYTTIPCKNAQAQKEKQCGRILICPNITPHPTTFPTKPPLPTLTCSDCLSQGQNYLCFDTVARISFCSNDNATGNVGNVYCVSCGATSSPTIFPTITCIPRPPCLDAPFPCDVPEPVDGWCPVPY